MDREVGRQLDAVSPTFQPQEARRLLKIRMLIRGRLNAGYPVNARA